MELAVDFDADDNFVSTGENLSPYLLGGECKRGRDYASQLTGRSSAGELRAVLDNRDGRFSSFNASSPLYGNLLPGRKVRLRAGRDVPKYAAVFVRLNSEHLRIADTPELSLTGDFTIVGFVQFLVKSGVEQFVAKWEEGSDKSYRIKYDSSPDRWIFEVSHDGSSNTASVTASNYGSPQAGFHMVAASHDAVGEKLIISVNGGASNETSYSQGIFDSDAPFCVGAQWNGSDALFGLSAAVAVFDKVLDQQELVWLYNSNRPRNITELGVADTDGADLLNHLVAWWQLDEESDGSSAVTRHDASGNGLDLTDINTVGSTAPQYVYSTTVYEMLWTGYLDRIEPSVVSKSLPTATLYAYGALARLAGANARISPQARKKVLTGAVVDAILDAAGWPAQDRSIDAGTVPISRWHARDREAIALLREIEDTEIGFLSEGRAWDIIFRGRYDRDIEHGSSRATFSDDGSSPLGYVGIRQSDYLREIYNVIEATVQRYALEGERVLWRYEGGPLVIPPSEATSVLATYPNQIFSGGLYVDEWTTVSLNQQNTPSVLGLILLNGSNYALISLINLSSTETAVLLGIEVSGIVVEQAGTVAVSASDATSQTNFGRRAYPLASPWFGAVPYARAACEYFIERHKAPRPILTLGLIAQNAATLEQQLTRDLADRITVEAESAQTALGISREFHVETISHLFGTGRLLETTWQLSPAEPAPNYFILDVSELDGSDVLAP